MHNVHVLAGGTAEGLALVLDEPLSFWGGIDPATGDVIDRHHAQHGANVRGRILVMPSGRGSSSSSSVLAEAVRACTAPAAIVLREPDSILLVGALVAEELYGRRPVIVVVSATVLESIRTGDVVHVAPEAVTPIHNVIR
jgi:predicted aconitase with swiveling domain